MLKNTAGQRWRVFAFYTSTGSPVEDIQATITATLELDGGSPVPTNDQNPLQATGKGGYYYFDLTKAETNANHVSISPSSVMPGVTVIGSPGDAYPSVSASIEYPYNSSNCRVVLTRLGDYKTGTPTGPLLIPITSNNVTVGDVVTFGAKDPVSGQAISVTGEVVSSDGSLYGSFEVDGDTHLDKSPSGRWRWGMEHTNWSGSVCPVASDMPMLLLEDRVQ